MNDKPAIHISDVNSFKQCRRKWDFSSKLRQNLEPNRSHSAFMIGSAVHFVLEHHYRGMDTRKALGLYFKNEVKKLRETSLFLEEDRVYFREYVHLVKAIIHHYTLWQSKDGSELADRNLEFVELEVPFSLPLRTPSGYPSRTIREGRIDGIVRHKTTGKYYLWEIKTARSVKERIDQAVLGYDEQTSMYLLAAEELYGKSFEGMIYTVLGKKAPTPVKILKDNTLSQDKRTATTYYAFIEQMLAHHTDLDKATLHKMYGEHLIYLQTKPNSFFDRVLVTRNKEQLRYFQAELHAVALEMNRKNTPIYASKGKHCSYCPYRVPCSMTDTNQPGELEAVLKEEYRNRLATHLELEESEESHDSE